MLDDPVLKAMSIFDHRYWPSDNDMLKASYTDELKLLWGNVPRARLPLGGRYAACTASGRGA